MHRHPTTATPLHFLARGLSFAALAGAVSLCAQEANRNPVALSKTVVSDVAITDAPPSVQLSQVTLSEISGAVKVVDNTAIERGKVATSADVLAFQPGVFAAPPAGSGDGIKISIRGSAIARAAGNFFRSGTLFTFDGLPVTGPGGTPYELFETYGLSHTEVLLGGNAFDYGALHLGGAINYVTRTAATAAPFEVRIDVGSFGYRKYQFAASGKSGAADYFVSAAALKTDGYQPNGHGRAEGFAGNFGYRLSDRANTRFFVRYRTTANENPGTLSLVQLLANSRQANPDNIVGKVNRVQPGSTWIGNRTDIKLGRDARLELGAVFHDAPIDIAPNVSPGTATNPNADRDRSIWNFRDLTLQAKFSLRHSLFGLTSDTTVAGVLSEEFFADVNTYANNPNVTTGPRAFGRLLKTANYDRSNDSSLRLSNQLGLTKQLWLNSGVILAYIRRASEVTYSYTGVTSAIDRQNLYLAPRIGLRYDVSPDLTFFANATRSIEAPNSWQPNRGANGAFFDHDNIQEQKAIAYELGGRFAAGPLSGGVSVFQSDVEDELLVVPLIPGNPGAGSRTFNGSDTYKRGLEVGLDTTVWTSQGWFRRAGQGNPSRLVFGQSWTLNDFGYENDPTFGKNELPGVPRQYYQAKLAFDHTSGFYLSLSAQYASSYYADFANTLEAPEYTLYGAGLGYTHPKRGWQVYLDVRNLTDETFASSANPTFLAGTTQAAREANPLFQSGDGLSVTGGITLKF